MAGKGSPLVTAVERGAPDLWRNVTKMFGNGAEAALDAEVALIRSERAADNLPIRGTVNHKTGKITLTEDEDLAREAAQRLNDRATQQAPGDKGFEALVDWTAKTRAQYDARRGVGPAYDGPNRSPLLSLDTYDDVEWKHTPEPAAPPRAPGTNSLEIGPGTAAESPARGFGPGRGTAAALGAGVLGGAGYLASRDSDPPPPPPPAPEPYKLEVDVSDANIVPDEPPETDAERRRRELQARMDQPPAAADIDLRALKVLTGQRGTALNELKALVPPNLKITEKELTDMQTAASEAATQLSRSAEGYRTATDDVAKQRFWEKMIHAVGYLVAGIYGLKSGTNMGGLKFEPTDWAAEFKRAADERDARDARIVAAQRSATDMAAVRGKIERDNAAASQRGFENLRAIKHDEIAGLNAAVDDATREVQLKQSAQAQAQASQDRRMTWAFQLEQLESQERQAKDANAARGLAVERREVGDKIRAYDAIVNDMSTLRAKNPGQARATLTEMYHKNRRFVQRFPDEAPPFAEDAFFDDKGEFVKPQKFLEAQSVKPAAAAAPASASVKTATRAEVAAYAEAYNKSLDEAEAILRGLGVTIE